MIKNLLCAWILLCFSALVSAETSVWKVSKNNHSIYLGGTIHLLSPSDYPLPDAYQQAYQQADTLVFEVDSDHLKTPQQQVQFARLMRLESGQSMADLLSEDTYQRLRQAATAHDIPIKALDQFSPVLITIQLTVLALKEMGMTAEGVDDFYLAKARNDSKAVETFETAEEQMDFIKQLARGNEDEFVRYSLQDLNELPVQMNQLKAAWRSGDQAALEQAGIEQLRNLFPDVYQQLLVSRNQRWLPQIKAMLTTPEREFILVGALHLVGEHGLLPQLRALGYEVTQL